MLLGIPSSKCLNVPLVLSYHTHLPVYARNYANSSDWTRTMGPKFCEWLSWKVLRVVRRMADLTLMSSPQIAAELTAKGVERVAMWRRRVDTARIHPKFRS